MVVLGQHIKSQSWCSVEYLAAYRCYCHVSYTRHRVCTTVDKQQQAQTQKTESKCRHARCQLPSPPSPRCFVTSVGILLLNRFTEVNWAGIFQILLHINENADFGLFRIDRIDYSEDNPIFNILRIWQTVFQNGSTVYYFHLL